MGPLRGPGALATFSDQWTDGYDIMEHIQLICFCVQELIISIIYIWEAMKLLRLRPEGPRSSILNLLLAINIVILILDVAVVVIEYTGYFTLQAMFRPVAHSVKLKLEYAILGNLVAISRTSYDSEQQSSGRRGIISHPTSTKLPPHEPRLAMEYTLPWFWEHL